MQQRMRMKKGGVPRDSSFLLSVFSEPYMPNAMPVDSGVKSTAGEWRSTLCGE